MVRPRRTSEVRQVELVDAALHIIATRGIADLSTRSLAEHVGLSSGAIFRHFASLDALLDAVVGRVEAVLASTYPPDDLPASERLERFVEARSAAVGAQVGMLRLVISEQFLLALPKSGSARLSACVQRSRQFVLRCIREAQNTGEFRTDVDAGTLAVIVMGTIQMLALSTSSFRHGTANPPGVRAGLIALLKAPGTSHTKQRKRST